MVQKYNKTVAHFTIIFIFKNNHTEYDYPYIMESYIYMW